jgi:TonB family protein
VIARIPFMQLEDELGRSSTHLSEFSPVSEPLALPRCGDVRPPEALVTPDPLVQLDDENLRVRVSFIVGTDGRVHSPFILDSGGPREDQMVLHAVRRWRYRPALCNGVPTDSEARVQFGIR